MPPGVARGMDGEKFKRKLSEVNTRAVSRGQNELVGKFKMAAGDMLVFWGRLRSTCTFQQELRLEGVSHQNCWRRTSGHSF